MKIFNWVHRKFNHNVIKDGFARNVKKTESIAIDTNTKALLEQVALVDVLDGWKDGILTIGTFGFDPLKPFDQPKEYFIFESEEEEDEEAEGEGVGEHNSVNNDNDHEYNNIVEDEEVNPLIFTTFGHNFEDIASNADADVRKAHDVIITLDGVPLTPFVGSPNELRFEIDSSDSDQGKRRRRTTLADLFSEDSDNNKKPNSDESMEPNAGKKHSVRTKNGLSFAKKLIPHVKEDSRPIKKIHQMMRRMLKRKIHPELEGKANKSESQNKASVLELLGKKHGAVESVGGQDEKLKLSSLSLPLDMMVINLVVMGPFKKITGKIDTTKKLSIDHIPNGDDQVISVAHDNLLPGLPMSAKKIDAAV